MPLSRASLVLYLRSQDPAQLLREAEALCERNENVLALGVLERIPETAPTQILVRKYTTIVEVLMSLNRLAEVPAHVARARALADTAGDPAALAGIESAEGLLLRVTQRGDRGLTVESAGKGNQSFALGQLAYVYWTFDRDTPRAIEHYTRAIDLAIEVQAHSMQASWRVSRGHVWRESGQYGPALADFRRALALWEASASGDRFAATKHIGHTYRVMGRLDEARAVLEPLVTTRPFNPTPRHLWAAQMELASTYEGLGDRQRAAEQYRAMLDVLEEHRNTSILDTFRSGSFAHSLTAYDPYERYMRFLTAGADAGDPTEALRVSEQARAAFSRCWRRSDPP